MISIIIVVLSMITGNYCTTLLTLKKVLYLFFYYFVGEFALEDRAIMFDMAWAGACKMLTSLGVDCNDLASNPLFLTTCISFVIVFFMCGAFSNREIGLEPEKNLVIVTGCDSGFGLGTVKELVSRGFNGNQ